MKGFKSLPFDADEEHYGCPVPKSPLTGKVDIDNWWTEQWYRSKYEASVFRSLAVENKAFNSTNFFSRVLEQVERAKS